MMLGIWKDFRTVHLLGDETGDVKVVCNDIYCRNSIIFTFATEPYNSYGDMAESMDSAHKAVVKHVHHYAV